MATRTITTKLALEGDAEYRAKIKNINSELAVYKSELEKVEAKYKTSANSLEALSAKQSALKGQLEALNKRHSQEVEMLEKARKAQQQFADEADSVRAKLESLKNSSSDTTEEQEKLAKQLADAEASMQKAANSANFYQKQLNNTERDQEKLGQELEQTGKYLAEAERSADECAESIDELGRSTKQAGDDADSFASKFKDGFPDALKGAGAAVGAVAIAATAVIKVLDDIAVATEEYRENQGKLNTAFEAAGYSTETAKKAYQDLYAVLGDSDNAAESAQLLAQLARSEEDVAKWGDIAAGVTGTFGDALPINSLIEAANETAKVGEVTGALADALNWVGISEDAFNEKLSASADESERTRLITETLSAAYQNASEIFQENNKVLMEANRAQAELDDSMAKLGGAVAEVKAELTAEFAPALSALAEAGADALTWATEFMHENELVGPAIVGAAVAVGALTAGVTLYTYKTELAAAKTALLSAVMNANPAVFLVSAMAGLAVAIGAYVAAADDADEKTRDFTDSLKDSKDAYEDLNDSMADQSRNNRAMASSLLDLLRVEEKSALQKDQIEQKVAKLNEAVPGLNLAYDREKDALIGVTEAELESMLAREEAQAQYEAQVSRLNELSTERAEIESRLKDARLALNEAEAAGTGNTRELQNTINELTAAQEENERQTAALEEASSAYGEAQAQAAAKSQEMQARVQELTDQMADLEESYQKSMEAAKSSLESQMGLFADLDASVDVSINDMIESLKRQTEYMDSYASNIQKAMELGVDKGLIQKLSDGSEESARILAEIVGSGKEEIANLNAEFRKVEQGKNDFSRVVADLETDFSRRMEEIKRELSDTIAELDQSEEARAAGANNIQGLINGTFSKTGALIAAYAKMGRDALAAYKKEVDQRSPSHKFEQAGRFDVQGLIRGAEEEGDNLDAAYAKLAQTALQSMERGLPSTLVEPPSAAAQDRQTAAIIAAVSNRGEEVGGIHIQIDKLVVRDESDVKRIAQELYYMARRENRSRGGGSL